MRHLRRNEPHDPELVEISKVLPDRWLDERWPQNRSGVRGRWPSLCASQLVRVHLLALVKRLDSFNRVCRELDHNIDFRRFCRLGPKQPAPTPRQLSEFREAFGLGGWTLLHLCALDAVATLHTPFAMGSVLVDATDLPGAVRRSSKKKTSRAARSDASKLAPAKALARRKAGSRSFSRVTRSTRFTD